MTPLRSVLVGLTAVIGLSGTTRAGAPSFEKDVAPILIRRCLECHTEGNPQGNLALTNEQSILKGGDSGPAISGNRTESYLLERVLASEMPPSDKGGTGPLPEEERNVLKSWIAAGSPWPKGHVLKLPQVTSATRAGLDWWSLQPIRAELPKSIAHPERSRGPIDHFILSKLEEQGMTLAPPADRAVLIRRLHADLMGLPPSYEEIREFSQAREIDAYERLVDRLLASPHFGERWGRHWLDVARYAETCGYERDQVKPHAWRYRDWVIDAFNQDMPYDRFVTEQLAGDELPDRNESTLIATGFLRLGTWNDEPNDPREYKYERVEDLIHTTTTAFIAMTVKCARCHDHKFDPIPQVDYYKLAAIFWAGHVEPRGADLIGGPTKEELGMDVLGYTDRGRAPPALRRLRKGDAYSEEEEVAPGILSLIPELDQPFEPAPMDSTTTHRRKQLAAWLVDAKHPLTSRVAVNRFWQHHFGEGLVRTPDNLGFTGDKPSHPELLDYLAREFVASDWQSKHLHRMLVESETYRQSAVNPNGPQYRSIDSGNRFLWHANIRRRDAESIRDAMLFVSEQLDTHMGGPSFKPEISQEALEGLSMKSGAWSASSPEEQRRRSIYMFSKRSLIAPLMTVFDFCDTSQSCARRDISTVAPQALALLNNPFVHQVSQHAADLLIAEARSDDADLVSRAWRLILARDPSDSEAEACLVHLRRKRPSEDDPALRRLALASLCQVLLNSNEFIYVD